MAKELKILFYLLGGNDSRFKRNQENSQKHPNLEESILEEDHIMMNKTIFEENWKLIRPQLQNGGV